MKPGDRKFSIEKADRLLDEARYRRVQPQRLLREIGLRSEMAVADIGCGNGFFSVAAAEVVGSNGIVHALDISEEMLNRLKSRQLPENVHPHLCGENCFPLPTSSIDFALVSAVLHEVDQPHQFLLEIRRILKDEGLLWILEWLPIEEEIGPPLHHRLAAEKLEEHLSGAGFRIKWLKQLGNSHYHLLVEKVLVRCCC